VLAQRRPELALAALAVRLMPMERASLARAQPLDEALLQDLLMPSI